MKELPLLKSGDIAIPKHMHLKNSGRHLLDIFRNWRSPPGIKLLMGLLMYSPALRCTAEEALDAGYFSTVVGCGAVLYLHVALLASDFPSDFL